MDRYERAALNFAKRYGYEGEKLPKGRRRIPNECPVAQAVGGRYVIAFPDGVAIGREIVPRSKLAAQFIRCFDLGGYPDLEI